MYYQGGTYLHKYAIGAPVYTTTGTIPTLTVIAESFLSVKAGATSNWKFQCGSGTIFSPHLTACVYDTGWWLLIMLMSYM